MKLTAYLVRGTCLLLCMMSLPNLSFSQCETNCEAQCLGQINVSLDRDCYTEITPAMGGPTIEPQCNSLYTVKLFDEYDVLINGTVVGVEYNGRLLKYSITENECGNTCWGNVLIEYKFPPTIECPQDMTVACGVVDLLDLPPATSGCADFDVVLLNQTKETLICEEGFSSKIIRTYVATDEFGNSSSCSHEIYIERVDIDEIIFPDKSIISCTDTLIRYDESGFPIPWYRIPRTGSGIAEGIPVLCDANVTNGLLCPGTDELTAIPLIPIGGAIAIIENEDPYNPGYTIEEIEDSNNTSLCNAILTYTDMDIPSLECKRKIMRIWEIREWWCTQEYTNSGVQFIEIVDDEAPSIVCPQGYVVSTSYGCGGSTYLEAVDVYDQCSSNIDVKIEYQNGVINGNGGHADLNFGYNYVTYVATDECHNQSRCEVRVEVKDQTSPVAICERNKVISLSQSEYTIVYAEPFDNGSFDECGIDRFEVRRMDSLCVAADTLFGESVAFCCGDVGQEVWVVFRVVDISGNVGECMVEVEVQDKLTPTLICPPDVEIDCYDAYDLNNLSSTFGYPESGDNCTIRNIHEVVDADVSQCGVGRIVRQFQVLRVDSSVVTQCKQVINIVNNANFLGENIIWPLDYVAVDRCDASNLLPEDLPDLYNYPSFGVSDECTLLGYNYEDRIFESQGGCLTIERFWTVINWCGNGNGTNQFDQWTNPLPQRIDIFNETPPEIVAADSLFFESLDVNCGGDSIRIIRQAIDDCEFLGWQYKVRDERDTIVFEGLSNIFEGYLPVGEYHIEWVVEDGCGNFDVDHQYVSMLNAKAPTPVCINGLTVDLVPMDLDTNGVLDAEMVELWAIDFNSGSSHSCGNQLLFSLSSDTTDRVVFFDCSHIGIQEVQLWVTDSVTGYQDFCRTFIEIQDNNGVDICERDSSMMSIIRGDVFTEFYEEIEDVEIRIEQLEMSQMTDITGEFNFGQIENGSPYEIVPIKDNDHINGLSTLDIILIQRHILGIEELNSPYKLMAADVNGDEQVTVTDLIELRKLILGINDVYTYNTSWRFVNAEHVFLDNSNPWNSEIPETYQINMLTSDMDVDFIGVKIGDVNESVDTKKPKSNNNPIVDVEVLTDKSYVKKGEVLTYSFKIDYNENISGLQLACNYDEKSLELIGVESKILDLNQSSMINYEKLIDGELLLTVSDSRSVKLIDDKFLELQFVAKKNTFSKSIINFDNQSLDTEIYINSNVYSPEFNVVNEFVQKDIVVYPNPWSEVVQFELKSDEEEDISIDLFDVNGKRLFSRDFTLTKGNNHISVRDELLDYKGVMYAKVTGKSISAEFKLLKL